MATHRVSTPVAGVNDKVGAVVIRNGVGELDATEHAAELAYFQQAGYLVEEIGDGAGEDEAVVTADVDGDGVPEELPKKSASTETWRAFAVGHGMTEDEAAELSRDELAAHYYSKEEGQ